MSAVIGYARVSTLDQNPALQIDALTAAGCTRIEHEKASATAKHRPILSELLRNLRGGDTLVVWKLDRVARSLVHLLEIIDRIHQANAHFRCVTAPIDTRSSVGTLMVQILGAVAEFERALLVERTKAGLHAAASRGRIGGNPNIRRRDPRSLERLSLVRRDLFVEAVRERIPDWLPVVRKHRPFVAWRSITRMVNASLALERRFTIRRLIRHVRTAIAERLITDHRYMDRSGSSPSQSLLEKDPALQLVVTAIRRSQAPTLASLAADLKAARIPTRRGLSEWPLSSVANLLKRAKLLKFELVSSPGAK